MTVAAKESGKSWSSIWVKANHVLTSVALIHGTNTPQNTQDGMPITVVSSVSDAG